jgi:hypothetical protein
MCQIKEIAAFKRQGSGLFEKLTILNDNALLF